MSLERSAVERERGQKSMFASDFWSLGSFYVTRNEVVVERVEFSTHNPVFAGPSAVLIFNQKPAQPLSGMTTKR